MTDDPGNEPDRKDNVIALSRYRARLGRGKRMRRIDALMAQPNPEQAIRALPGDELYYLLREDDPREARDLLAYARPEQIRVVLDFGLWSGDQLVPGRLAEWVDIMAEMPYETVGAWVKGLDTELIGLLIRKGARIYDVSIEEPPDEPEGTFYATPDRLFVLDVVGYHPGPEREDGAAAAEEQTPSASALIRIIDSLYRDDMNFVRRILVAAKAELDSELEEMALRWRQGRMADLGFIDPIEALEIYKELDPASVRIGELRPGTRMRPRSYDEVDPADKMPPDLLRAPAILGAHLGSGSLFARALGRVTAAAEIEELHFALVALANRVLAADRVDAADDAAVAAGMARMRGTLDIGVEFLSRAGGNAIDEDRAVDAVRTVAPMRLFRLGVSLVGKVRALAQALLRRGPFAALDHLDLVEEPEASVLGAVAAVDTARPLYLALLDDPPAAGERPFESLADIARATVAIQRAGVAQAMLLGLGVRPELLLPRALEGVSPSDPNAIDTGVLARTAIILALSRSEPTLAVSDSADRPPATQANDQDDGRDEQRDAAQSSGPAPGSAFRAVTAAEMAAFRRSISRRPRGSGRAKKEGAKTELGASREPVPLPEELRAKIERILLQAAPPRMEQPAREMAHRWLATLSPLEPVLQRAP